jgi:NMD protein affecting ribosome stability and mRNA decay
MSHKYKTWHGMIRRCYDEKSFEKYPSYKDCTVCDEWHNYQTFGEWYDQNYYEVENETMALDKDILVKGNRIYRHDACIFVPQRINSIFTKKQSSNDNLPIGVSINKNNSSTKIYTAKYGNKVYINSFNTIDGAFQAYKKYKELLIRDIANEYIEKIPPKLYEVMINYKVEFTD